MDLPGKPVGGISQAFYWVDIYAVVGVICNFDRADSLQIDTDYRIKI